LGVHRHIAEHRWWLLMSISHREIRRPACDQCLSGRG
jgi:hypothetical protein